MRLLLIPDPKPQPETIAWPFNSGKKQGGKIGPCTYLNDLGSVFKKEGGKSHLGGNETFRPLPSIYTTIDGYKLFGPAK
jgi:hypothetical protein